MSVEAIDWLARAKEGDAVLNERTRDDEVLAHHVAIASKAAYEKGLEYEMAGNRDAAIQNFVEARHIGQFITKLYDSDPNSRFLASWK